MRSRAQSTMANTHSGLTVHALLVIPARQGTNPSVPKLFFPATQSTERSNNMRLAKQLMSPKYPKTFPSMPLLPFFVQVSRSIRVLKSQELALGKRLPSSVLAEALDLLLANTRRQWVSR